ncbi:MAG: tRNA preQ1(34) S-adenosylmethionine ribosyltransferase-isomerase QueA [Spirochaetes bacterium]|nr:tRNA preQ1(34) S-adenosylmethionine ribosyltransferase-isomerase QueA [Spirochaetota bacterium]MBN2771713.1 tRNA preQ1(34) S-adenosylmethionine ribosyltransferase-isomerase QueA [Spirochaetota bacterium]
MVQKLEDYNFYLPENLIAQNPAENREDSRLLVLSRSEKTINHDHFRNIYQHINAGDVLVFNDAKVIPARLCFKRSSGAEVEIVLARMINRSEWYVISNRTKKLKPGEKIQSLAEPGLNLEIVERKEDFLYVKSSSPLTDELLMRVGSIPLPPYIQREASANDIKRYQTIYARKTGAVAAPTAGLHFTKEIMDKLEKKGVILKYLTLYVSWGTFSPVRSDNISEHKMHSEYYDLSKDVTTEINKARVEKRRVIAVGTTALRVLESTFVNGVNVPGSGDTDIFIYPPYKIKSIDALITNFHTPKSTLLMLVSAFAGYDAIMNAYKEAVDNNYRFFSYGDSMLIC